MELNKPTKKDHSFLYILSTLGFIIIGIILTSVINNNKPTEITVKASATAGITATAVVSEIQSTENLLVVTNLIFPSSKTTNMGSWKVTPPAQFQMSSIQTGDTIELIIDQKSFSITTHSVSAKSIKKK